VIAWLWRLVARVPAMPTDPVIATLIKAPRFRDGWDKPDDALRQRTQQKREAAGRYRARAHKVESGSSVADLLRTVGKR
jgi:hypothetical protein